MQQQISCANGKYFLSNWTTVTLISTGYIWKRSNGKRTKSTCGS